MIPPLSKAMRAGAKLKPQAFGEYTDGVGTCALGAANEGAGLSTDYTRTPDAWLATLHAIDEMPCPECGCGAADDSLIVHLNDWHRWTRERIATFVARLERSLKQ